jgi:hypothetical protein
MDWLFPPEIAKTIAGPAVKVTGLLGAEAVVESVVSTAVKVEVADPTVTDVEVTEKTA